MAKFSISDAAARAGVERTTLYRKLHKGEISAEIDAHGIKVIDAAELLRVYPDARVTDAAATTPQQLHPVEKQRNATADATDATGMLMREVEIRDERIQELKQRIESLEADKADLRGERDKLLKVIEEQSTSVKLLTAGDKGSSEGEKKEEAAGKRGWFFGRRR